MSIAWLKWSIFWFVIPVYSSEEFVTDVLTPVGCEFESRKVISFLWSAVGCSPFALMFSLQNVVFVASTFSMSFKATPAATFDVMAANLACFRRSSCLSGMNECFNHLRILGSRKAVERKECLNLF